MDFRLIILINILLFVTHLNAQQRANQSLELEAIGVKIKVTSLEEGIFFLQAHSWLRKSKTSFYWFSHIKFEKSDNSFRAIFEQC